MGNVCGNGRSKTAVQEAAQNYSNGDAKVVTPAHKETASAPATKAEAPPAGHGNGAGHHVHKSLASQVLDRPTPDVKSLYDFGKVLGKGQFGTTRLAICKKTGAKLACKSISKRKLLTQDDVDDVRREVQIMHHLAGHPNVVKLEGAYEDKVYVHLVMELCSGGELFDRIIEKGRYTEKDAANLIRTIVKVVAHCHAMGVIHRDLKPENFLLVDKTASAAIKATDFGLSVFFKEGQEFKDVVGSAYYVAPEVLRRKYSKESDIWSCGVILYILLSGVPPFYGENETQIFHSVMNAQVDFRSDPWPKLSPAAKDCVMRMLVRDPKKRATAEEVLRHEWVRENGVATDKEIEVEVLKRIKNFAAMNRLKKEALKVIAVNLPSDEISGLHQMFQSLDSDKSGTITVEELREGLRKKGSMIPESELQRLMEHADVNGNGTIDYEEFLAATMHQGKLEREENLFKAFQHFDADNSGFITVAELKQALQVKDVDMKVIDDILKEVDKDGNGMIDYEEFCTMMRSTEAKAPNLKCPTVRRGHLNVKSIPYE